MVVAFQGAIVAAGRGDRLRASTGVELPKPLVEVGGVPLLVRQANAMLSAGAEEVLAIVNSETASLAHAVWFPPALQVIVRDTDSSMESLFALGERLRSGHFLLATVDTVVSRAEFDGFVAQARQLTTPDAVKSFDGVLAVVKWRGDRRPLFTEVTDSGLITSLGKRETRVVTAGMYWLSTAIFQLCAAARRRRLEAMREFLQMLIEEGTRLGAVEVQDAIDIDEASDLAAARRMLAD